jgi:hypothetical protein
MLERSTSQRQEQRQSPGSRQDHCQRLYSSLVPVGGRRADSVARHPAGVTTGAGLLLDLAERKGATVSASFEADIKNLFREDDRSAMLFAFDLWSADDVRKNADAILAQLESGSMPCDGAWPEERVKCFRDWIESGKPS